MLKVYFDNNVYSDICKGIDREFIEIVYKMAERQVLFLYSQAHLNDLSADKTDYKNEELRIIEEIANDNFLHLDTESNQITTSLIKAKEAFDHFGDNQNDTGVFLESLLANTGDPLGDKYIDHFKMQPVDLGDEVEKILAKDDKDPEKGMYVRLGITERHYTLGELLTTTAKMIRSLENEPDLIKSIRLLSKQHLQVDKFNIKIDDFKFDEKLSKSKIGKSFKELLNQQLSCYPDYQKSFYFEFITGYNMINFLGFDYEKNRKVRFKSTQNDGQHSYYGAVSDIVVSRDEGLLNKSRFLYRYYGIDTKVMSITEFKKFITAYKDVTFSNELLFIADLRFKMDRSIVVVETRPIIRHNQNEEVRKLITPYWGLFNYISRVKLNDNDHEEYIVLYPNRFRSGNVTFYKDINYIIGHLNKMLKLEHDYLSDEDKNLINNGDWKGRFWQSTNTVYWLRFNYDTKRIGLQIGPIA